LLNGFRLAVFDLEGRLVDFLDDFHITSLFFATGIGHYFFLMCFLDVHPDSLVSRDRCLADLEVFLVADGDLVSL